GGFFLTTVGRVQTPTLSIVVEREEKIRKHVARDYWELKASFDAEAGQYEGKWFDPKWKKNPDDAELRADRLWTEADAQAIAQALYEKHKVLTYPRTDSKFLPEDYVAVVKKTMQMLAEEDMPGPLRPLSGHAKKAIAEGYVKPNKKIFDNAKVSDHFAIIPTLQPPKSLTELEAKLYDMVVKRFLAVFYPPAEFMVTTRISTVKAGAQSHSFQTNGKV